MVGAEVDDDVVVVVVADALHRGREILVVQSQLEDVAVTYQCAYVLGDQNIPSWLGHPCTEIRVDYLLKSSLDDKVDSAE